MSALEKFGNIFIEGICRVLRYPLAMEYRPKLNDKISKPLDMASIHVGIGPTTRKPRLFIQSPDGEEFEGLTIAADNESYTYYSAANQADFYLDMVGGITCTATRGYPLGSSGRYALYEIDYRMSNVTVAGEFEVYFNGILIYTSPTIGVAALEITGIEEGNLVRVASSPAVNGNMLSIKFNGTIGAGAGSTVILKTVALDIRDVQ